MKPFYTARYAMPSEDSDKVSRANSFIIKMPARENYWPMIYQVGVSRANINLIGEIMKKLLSSKNLGLADGYLILHDKYYNEKGEIISDDNNYCHYHALLRLEKRTSLTKLAKVLELPLNHIKVMSKEDYSYSNFLSHLIHYSDPEKFVYDPIEVATIKGTDYISLFLNNKDNWLAIRSRKEKLLRKSKSNLTNENSETIKEDSDYSNYTLLNLLDGINSGVIDIATIVNNSRLMALTQLHTEVVEKALIKEKNPIYQLYMETLKEQR